MTHLVIVLLVQSCSDYLDVVPDNVATIDNAFKLKNEAEKYLFTCYSYLPSNGGINSNLGMLTGDEIWIPYRTSIISDAFEIARGNQRVSSPYMNVWEGGTYNLFIGLRHCNIFLENIKDTNKVPDLDSALRRRWIGK